MPLILTAGMVFRVKAVCYNPDEDQVGENSYHYEVASTAGSPSLGDAADWFSNRMAVPYKSFMSNRTRWEGCELQKLSPGSFSQTYVGKAAAGPGLLSVLTVPNQVTGLITYYTEQLFEGVTGKKYFPQSRLFIPFPAASLIKEGGLLNDAGIGALNTISNAMGFQLSMTLGGGNSAIIRLVTFRRRDKAIAYVTARDVSQYWATQTRRAERGRRNLNPLGA